ncbi:UNKNOWN [Stylonychia lemnae]|uniref:Uncharacterized protein n=1 Tax=Stylonychia lemnae TaxID=5949 RepID=A0A077ZZZ3_STYLE|nr:UNKNOWN [Stylonychia lemnae]|eukprot:CDW74768.1 UNKNOWN [Stylonychia lemnae]
MNKIQTRGLVILYLIAFLHASKVATTIKTVDQSKATALTLAQSSLQSGQSAWEVSAQVANVAEKAGAFAKDIAKAAESASALKSVAGAIAAIGPALAALGAVAAFAQMFFPSPVEMKLDAIQDSINSLQNMVSDKFDEQASLIKSISCGAQLSQHLNEIETNWRYYQSYVNSRGADPAYRALLQTFDGVPEAAIFILNALNGKVTNCDIIQILYEGDQQNGFMRGSPKYVAATQKYLMEVQKAIAMIGVWYVKTANFQGNQVAGEIEFIYGRHIRDASDRIQNYIQRCYDEWQSNAEFNMKKMYPALKEQGPTEVVVAIKQRMNEILYDQHVFVNVYEDPENGEHHTIMGQRWAVLRTRDLNLGKKLFISVVTAPKSDTTDYTDRLHFRRELDGKMNSYMNVQNFINSQWGNISNRGLAGIHIWRKGDWWQEAYRSDEKPGMWYCNLNGRLHFYTGSWYKYYLWA